MGRQFLVERGQGPLGQPPLGEKGAAGPQSADHRQQKAQGGAGLAAGQGRLGNRMGPIQRRYPKTPVFPADPGTQAGKAPDGGFNILGGPGADQLRGSIRQRRAQQKPVGLGF